MPTIGTNCDLILTHADVNGGVGVGFQLQNPHKGIRITREAYITADGSTYTDRIKYLATLKLSDEVRDPSGAIATPGRAALYALLLAFLAERTEITLQDVSGTYTDLHATLQTSIEEHGRKTSIVVLSLNNGGFVETVPFDVRAYNSSFYDSGITYDLGVYR